MVDRDSPKHVASTLSIDPNGCCAGSGSSSKTSIAAPANTCDRNALISDDSSTVGPRDVLIKREVGFISASSAAPTSWCAHSR
jgi:hypothetical protein